MKKLLVLLSLLGGFLPAFAISISAPGQVTSGSAYTVTATHNHYLNPPGGFSVIILKNGAQVAGNGGGGSGSVTVTTTYNTTDTGNQTITYTGSASTPSGTFNATAQTQIIVPNSPPTISWVQNPASAAANQAFAIQARGDDINGNLTSVNVWREWTPFAFNGGGNGYTGYSDANSYSQSTPGTVTFMAQAQDSSGATSAVIYHTVTIFASNGVTFNSTNWPASVDPSQSTNFYYNITNSGSKTWGVNHYIGLIDQNWSGVTFPSVNGWAVGATGNVNFGFTAPSAPGNYTYYLQALENNVEWFGPIITKTLTVNNRAPTTPLLVATVNGGGVTNNGNMQMGEQISLTSTMHDDDGNLVNHTIYYQKNTTGAAPDPAGWIPLDSGTPSNGTNSTKTSVVTANSSGRWDFHTNGNDAYGVSTAGYSITVYVYGGTNGATFISQSGPPATMQPGQTAIVSVKMRNTKDRPWTIDATPHRLGPVNDVWGISRVELPIAVVNPYIQTGADTVFSFTITAPSAPTTHTFQWRMLEEGLEWFGDVSAPLTITVSNVPPAVVSATGGTIEYGQTFSTTLQATDANADLRKIHLVVANSLFVTPNSWEGTSPDGWKWRHFRTDLVTGASATLIVPVQDSNYGTPNPLPAGIYRITLNAEDSLPNYTYNPANVLATLTVNRSTPSGTFANHSYVGSHALTASDLNATFTNPYSGAVLAPSSYSIVAAAGGSASPTSGLVYVGTTLAPGTYTIRASYSADSNYNAATKDATFTISSEPNADDDGDGVTNGLEQELGLNPADPNDTNVYRYEYDRQDRLKKGPGNAPTGEYTKDAEGNIKKVR